jgi:hypothetical protein
MLAGSVAPRVVVVVRVQMFGELVVVMSKVDAVVGCAVAVGVREWVALGVRERVAVARKVRCDDQGRRA